MSKSHPEDKSKLVRLDRSLVEEVSNFLFALGNQFVNVKNASGAFDCFRYSVDLNPKNQASVYNLGALYNVMGDLEGSYRMFKEASRMRPEDLVAQIALGEVARKLDKMEESRQILERVYKIDPENYMVLSAIAILHYDSGHLAEALEWNERALEKRPGDVHMILNQALINMTYGRWVEFWGQYEYCLSYQRNEKMKNLSMSGAWSGQEMKGKTLLVISDQGSGDAIQFSRYLAEAKALGKFAKLIYLVQPDLRDLLSRVDGVDEAVGFSEKSHLDYDSYSALLGVMRILKVSPEDCWRPPHIKTDPFLDKIWESRINSQWDGKSKKVAFVWHGDPRHGADKLRSIPLTQFLKLTNGFETTPPVSGVQLFSFQVGAGESQISTSGIEGAKEIVEMGPDFRSFDDTASALKQMDLLITCDTSVGHLAGCLGIPTWWCIAATPEWRHGLNRGDSPWYKESKIYRQTTIKEWDPVFRAVMSDLQEFANGEEAAA